MSVRQWCIILLLVIAGPAFAHKPSDSYLTLSTRGAEAPFDVRWDIALRDLNQAIGLDSNQNGEITWGELRSRSEAVSTYASSRLAIRATSESHRAQCPLEFRQLLFDEHIDGGYAVLKFVAACPQRAEQVVIDYRLLFDVDPNHRGLLEVSNGSSGSARVLSAEHPSASIDLQSYSSLQQLRAFIGEGIWHIWHGYDHILFLFTLLLPAVVIFRSGHWEARESVRDSLLDVTKVVTAFTIAHSVTLFLAVRGFVHLPSRLIESAIALTVLLGALNNLFPVVRERRWAVAFCFGLIHGFGFGSVLTDLGLQRWQLGVALIGFNLGVEAGQFALVLLLVPLAYCVRGTRLYRQALMPAGAIVIGLLAIYWFASRAVAA